MRELCEDMGAAGGEPSAALRSDPFSRTDPPLWSVRLWPHRSLSPEGFRWIMGIAAAGFALPLIALAPSGVSLSLLPFALAALAALWAALKFTYFTGRLEEELRLWPDVIAVERREPRGEVRRWAANPYWVDVETTETREVEHYLTLRGAGRRIELGAFLTPEERQALADELRRRIARLKSPG